MAALLGINVDRTISITFVHGRALAAVAGVHVPGLLRRGDFCRRLRAGHQGVHRGRARRHRLAARRRARRSPDRPDRDLLVGYFSIDYKDVAVFSILAVVLIFMPSGLLGKPEVEKV
jgi:branched-chain amino acid transport system permease protein